MIYVFLANGFEEVEALGTVDFLRRCDLEVKTLGIGSKYITGAHNITVEADCLDFQISLDDIQAIVLPGGMPGTLNLEKSPNVQSAIDFAVENDKVIAAICAAPSILGHKMLLQGKTVTCFPGFSDELIGANATKLSVCEDGNIITGKSAGAVFKFAHLIAKRFVKSAKADAVLASLECADV